MRDLTKIIKEVIKEANIVDEKGWFIVGWDGYQGSVWGLNEAGKETWVSPGPRGKETYLVYVDEELAKTKAAKLIGTLTDEPGIVEDEVRVIPYEGPYDNPPEKVKWVGLKGADVKVTPKAVAINEKAIQRMQELAGIKAAPEQKEAGNHIFAFGQWWDIDLAKEMLANMDSEFDPWEGDEFSDEERDNFEKAIAEYDATQVPQTLDPLFKSAPKDDLMRPQTLDEYKAPEDSEGSERFEEIIEDVKALIKEAYKLVPSNLKQRAKSYWYGHIISAIDDDHEFMGRGSYTMKDTLDDLKGEEEIDDEEDEEV
jgi:hypothetical protein